MSSPVSMTPVKQQVPGFAVKNGNRFNELAFRLTGPQTAPGAVQCHVNA